MEKSANRDLLISLERIRKNIYQQSELAELDSAIIKLKEKLDATIGKRMNSFLKKEIIK